MDYRVARIIRWVIYGLLTILVLFLLWLALNAILNLVKPSKNTSTSSTTNSINLVDYQNNGSQFKYTVTGPVVANPNFRKTVITVSAGQAVVEVTKGYESAPSLSQAFANNQTAFTAFVSALTGAGFGKVKEPTSGTNPDAICPTADKYYYQIVSGGTAPLNTWNTSCNVSGGSFNGSTSLVMTLFQAQIPNYDSIVSTVQ